MYANKDKAYNEMDTGLTDEVKQNSMRHKGLDEQILGQ